MGGFLCGLGSGGEMRLVVRCKQTKINRTEKHCPDPDLPSISALHQISSLLKSFARGARGISLVLTCFGDKILPDTYCATHFERSHACKIAFLRLPQRYPAAAVAFNSNPLMFINRTAKLYRLNPHQPYYSMSQVDGVNSLSSIRSLSSSWDLRAVIDSQPCSLFALVLVV
jgi:hypothetical protein